MHTKCTLPYSGYMGGGGEETETDRQTDRDGERGVACRQTQLLLLLNKVQTKLPAILPVYTVQ